MEYMLTFHILNVYADKTQPRQFKFTFKDVTALLRHVQLQDNVTFYNNLTAREEGADDVDDVDDVA